LGSLFFDGEAIAFKEEFLNDGFGAVLTAIKTKPTGLFLLAPAGPAMPVSPSRNLF